MIQEIKGIQEISHRFKNYFFDLDGVLWWGNQNIPGSLDALKQLRNQGKNLYFVTNSSVRTREVLQKRFQDFGFKANLDECFPSSYIGALYLRTKYPEINKIMCFGSELMVEEFRNVGIEVNHVFKLDDDCQPIKIREKYLDKSCQAVVCGWDRYMNFSKAALASLQIQNGCKFLVTNPDKYTMIGGFRIPGNGAIYSMIEKGSGVSPEIMGKPNTFIIDNIIKQKELQKQDSIMIGDNIQTDMQFGNGAGITTLCLLTGVSKVADIENSEGLKKPTFYSKSLSGL